MTYRGSNQERTWNPSTKGPKMPFLGSLCRSIHLTGPKQLQAWWKKANCSYSQQVGMCMNTIWRPLGLGWDDQNRIQDLCHLYCSTPAFLMSVLPLVPYLGARKLYVGIGQGSLGMKAWKTLDNQGPESATQTSTPVSG